MESLIAPFDAYKGVICNARRAATFIENLLNIQ